jgi:hypothetical protein
VGKANGSRECAPDDTLCVPTVQGAFGETVGTAQVRLYLPYEPLFVIPGRAFRRGPLKRAMAN